MNLYNKNILDKFFFSKTRKQDMQNPVDQAYHNLDKIAFFDHKFDKNASSIYYLKTNDISLKI